MNSPVFRNFVISEDGKTTGIIVNIKKDEVLSKLKDKKAIENYKEKLKKQNHQNIIEIRKIIQNYKQDANIFLGGIPMIADDMMTFIKNDIVVFGVGVLLFIIATLWFVFRKLIWIIVPISSCFFSFNHDWSTRYTKLESDSHIFKLYCTYAYFNDGYEYSYEY